VDGFAFFLLVNLLAYGDLLRDPANASWFSQQRVRQLECERLSQAEAHARHPGTVPPPNARSGALMQVDALACRHLLVAEGARSPRDEAILQRLEQDVGELVGLAAAVSEPDTRWIVDAHYPSPPMVRKIAGSARVALAERGRQVSDAPPRLSAGDVEVLRTLPMREAIPFACRRLHASGALQSAPDDDVALLSIALLHPGESQLHAGTCRRGEFRWLR
jgi:hypothetical protein